jgi:dTDP-4-dehydrorhamnose reductase
MKILILGISGMLGHRIFKQLTSNPLLEVYGTLRRRKNNFFAYKDQINRRIFEIDVSDFLDFSFLISNLKPNIIINCIGIIKQNVLSDNLQDSLTINSLFPHKLASLAFKNGSRVIHISTDCVFSGKKGGYVEEDLSDVSDSYGISKFLGELHYPHTITLRTSIIGHEIDTNVGLLEWFLSQDNEINGYSKAVFSGFTTNELSKVIEKHLLFNCQLSGLYHLATRPIDKFNLLCMIKEIYKKNISILNDQSYVIDRSLNSAKFESISGYKPPEWKSLILNMYNEHNLIY